MFDVKQRLNYFLENLYLSFGIGDEIIYQLNNIQHFKNREYIFLWPCFMLNSTGNAQRIYDSHGMVPLLFCFRLERYMTIIFLFSDAYLFPPPTISSFEWSLVRWQNMLYKLQQHSRQSTQLCIK